MVRYLVAWVLCIATVCGGLAWADVDNARVSLLPNVLPPLPGVGPLEQARAQALVSFLHAHRVFGNGRCNLRSDLCFPEFDRPFEATIEPTASVSSSTNAEPSVLPAQAAALMTPPTTSPLLITFGASTMGETPTHGLTYLARAGDVIRAPFSGQVRHVQSLSAGRTQLSIEHEGEGVRLSVLTGQMALDVTDGDEVVLGQPLARAQPRRDGNTRLIYHLIIDGVRVDPVPWFQPVSPAATNLPTSP